MANLIPFPSRRRSGFLRTTANAAARYRTEESGRRYIRSLVARHRARLQAFGVDSDIIEQDSRDLEQSLLGHLAVARMTPHSHGAA